MTEPVDPYGYPCKLRNLTKSTWFYEQRGGVDVVVQHSTNVTITRIPWRKLEAAVDRHRKNKRRLKS